MTTEKWQSIYPIAVKIAWLHPTQDVKSEWVQAKRYNPTSSYCGDPYPHCVLYDGKIYISDGHHRIALYQELGQTWCHVRLFNPGDLAQR